jgi:exodeoxyribonuclease VII large subunit
MPEIDTFFSRDIYSVSRLNAEVRAALEGGFPLLWVQGEISNLARPSSGHLYFTLKDAQAQVRCALFRMKRNLLRFDPQNGQEVLLRARISFYEPRGEFQLVAEHIEPAGAGALRLAFETLKAKLAAEGLFDPARKRPLPPFPRQIGVITSPAGAAVRDVLSVLRRRFAAIPVLIYPTQVQGATAPAEIVEAIRLAARRGECDLLILTRGGGSLEDLAAFNHEGVARAIFDCPIPIVSAVGHEIDFTIADFVADHRAATPSAAAELASPDGAELGQRIRQLAQRMLRRERHLWNLRQTRLQHLTARLQRLHPERRLEQQQQRLDELEQRLERAALLGVARAGERLGYLHGRLVGRSPGPRLQHWERLHRDAARRLRHAVANRLQRQQQTLAALVRNLHALSPLATLERGYAIARRGPGGEILRDAAQAAPGDYLEVRLARGVLRVRVEG